MDGALVLKKQGYAGLFVIALATLMYEILLTRIFSVTMWYHFAFVAISVAMFGMTVGAILVYVLPNHFTSDRAKIHLALGALLFAVSSVLGLLTHLIVPVRTEGEALLTLNGVYALFVTYAMISLPFVFSGICVCICLTKFPRQVSKLYAADLAGAALGCILVIYTLRVTDGLTAVIVVAFLGSLGAALFAVESRHGRLIRTTGIVTLVLAVFAGGHTLLSARKSPLLRIVWVKSKLDLDALHEEWNSFSRVTVTGRPDLVLKPFGWSLSPVVPESLTARQLWLLIDAHAGTIMTAFDGDLGKVQHLKYDLTNLVHHIRPASKVLVIGAGGGRDILSALVFGQKEAVGVELNPAIIKMLRHNYADFTGHLERYPNVRLVNDEARSYIARQEENFDIIQVSLIDTSAATAAGAFVLAEHGIYTVEAWRIFLERLSDDGVLTVTRMYVADSPAEGYRLTSLASAALMSAGVENPRDHIIIAKGPTRPDRLAGVVLASANILLSKKPFSSADLATIEDVTRKMQFELALTPTRCSDPIFAKLASGKDLEKTVSEYPMNIAPPTDDSPFFFFMLRLRDAFTGEAFKQKWYRFNRTAIYTLGALLVVVTVLTLLCIIVPLMLTTQKAALRGALPLCGFFACIGLGFMLVEISQMQRLIIFLGHPTYGLSVVLFSLLLSSGCGSLATQWVKDSTFTRQAVILLLVLLGVLVTFGALTPYATRGFQASTTPVRILLAVGILSPLGLFMGMAFPLGMKVASRTSSSLTPWLWGINGATSVLASVVAIVIALTAGISVSFWTGVVCYVLAFAAFVWQGRLKSC